MPDIENTDPVTNPTPPPPVAPAESKAAEPAAAEAPAVDVAAQLAAAKAEAAANFDRFLRAAADLENFRRRTVREKDDLRLAAVARVMEDVYPVLDTLALAITAARQPNADLSALVGGVEMVLARFKTALGGHGLKEINPVGQPFDPHQHEAISHVAHPEVKEEHVVTVVRLGYSLNGRLLRPASVVVSSGPAKPEGKT